MSGNRNTEEEVGQGAGGGSGWQPFLYVAATEVAAFLWQTYQSKKKKMPEMEQNSKTGTLMNQVDVIQLSVVQTVENPTEEEEEKHKFKKHYLEILDKLEDQLVERQHLYCSDFKPKSERKKLECQIMEKFSYVKSLTPGLEKIFREDHVCGSSFSYMWTGDKRNNGKIMWEQLENWRKHDGIHIEIPGKP